MDRSLLQNIKGILNYSYPIPVESKDKCKKAN